MFVTKKLKILLLLLSFIIVSQSIQSGTKNIYQRQESCGWFGCSKESTGYCDSFTSFETDFFAGYNKQYFIVSCTYSKGVFIYDIENMNIVKQWTSRSTVGIPSWAVQHSSSIKMFGSLLITLEDWDGLEALDYRSSSANAAIAKTQCGHHLCRGDRTVHRQMIQLIDPQTQQGGRFLYAYSKGSIRYTKIINNGGSYSWQEVREPLNLNVESYGVTGVSQLEGTKLVIFSTTTGFQIYDAGQDSLPKVPTTTNASANDLDCQYAAQIKGSRMIVTYDEGVLKVFEISPPDIFPINIEYVKKHSINRHASIKELQSFGGRQVALITQNFAEVWDIGVIDNENLNTSYQMTRLKDLRGVDDFGTRDYSAGIFRIPNTNYVVYNNNNFDIVIDYVCHFSCGDCNANGRYGECTSCAGSTNYNTASDGLKMEKNRTLRNNQCLCEDNNNPCTYVDIGSQYCYHETAFSDSPTKCCGTNSCKNDYNADKCIERSEQCPVLEQLAVFFDPLSGYWYPTPDNPEYNCHYTCYVCFDPTATKCRSCDDAVTNRELIGSPGECKCKAGYKERNPGSSKICEYDAPCVAKCVSCSFGVCSQCRGSQSQKDTQTCECLPGYKDDGSDGCIIDCNDSVTKRYLDNGSCVCQNGYQETSPASANCEEKPCVSKCVSCSLGVCSQCEGTQTNKDPQTCECIAGYKFQGINCVKDCQDSFTNRELFNGQCVCQSGYYEANAGDYACIELPCNSKCSSCSKGVCSSCIGGNDNKNVQTCNCNAGYNYLSNDVCEFDCSVQGANKGWNNLTSQCECLQGYNDDDVPGTCVEDECGPKCQNCDRGNCLACFGSTDNRKPAGNDKATSCMCRPGFEDYNNKCRKICNTASTNRVNDPSNLNFCKCADGYEDLNDSSDDSDKCTEKTCFLKCDSCSLGVCQTCKKPANRDLANDCACYTDYIENASGFCEFDCKTSTTKRELNSQNKCVCQKGFQEANPGDANCSPIPCAAKCATCVLGECKACKDNQDNKDDQTCECLPGYHLVGNQCLWNCLTDLTYKELVDPSGTDCACKTGYEVASADQFICTEIPCAAKCKTCVLGVCNECQGDQDNKNSTTCECNPTYTEISGKCYLECDSENTNRVINFLTETCECKNGYYEKNSGDANCSELPCTDKCLSCNKGVCIECKGSPLYRDAQTCECQQKTVEVLNDGETREQCIPIKKGQNREPTQPFSCKAGFYEQENSYDCLPCSPLCKTCTDQNECTECTFSFFNKPPTCRVFSVFNEVSQEQQNLQEDLATCETQPGCKKCDEQTGKCLECDSSLYRELNKFTSECVCVPGYKEYRNLEACQKCYYYAGECLITCPKNTELDPSTQRCKDIQYESIGNVTYLIILVAGVIAALFLTTCGVLKMPLKVQVKEVHIEIDNGKQVSQQDDEENNSDEVDGQE